MNTKRSIMMKLIFISIMLLFLSTGTYAQIDTLQAATPDTTAKEPTTDEGKKDKRKDEFILYAGLSFNSLSVSSDIYESEIQPGYLLGAAYKRGKFFYWQAGIRFNGAGYNLKDITMAADTSADADNIFSVNDIDFPLNVGINLLSATNRVLALRIFVGAVPSFVISVGDNDVGMTKEKVNSFNLYGQGGVGFNVAFMVIEAGYNYGFMDVFDDDVQSKPGQVFVNIGFRF